MSKLIDTIETDIKTAWGVVEGAAVAAAKLVWEDFKPTFTALLPEEYAILKTAILGVLQGAEDKSLEEVETALLNAGAAEVALVKKLGSSLTQAVIAVVKAA